MWLRVPAAKFQGGETGRDTICRMASILHDTTINAQGFVLVEIKTTVIGGEPGRPNFEPLDTTPFRIGRPQARQSIFEVERDAERPNETRRVPKDLEPFVKSGRTNSDIIKNPNLVLENAIVTSNLDIKEAITFTVTTGNSNSELNAGGTTNIALLAGLQTLFAQPLAIVNNLPRVEGVMIPSPGEGDDPDAHADFMTSTFYVERIKYDVVVD
jgi:hypothetical protein